jgi:hypothetical protein
MNTLMRVIVLSCAMGTLMPSFAEEPPAEKMNLKDGSVLFLHPDGTGRMVDAHGKPMAMADGVAMETADGRMIMMKNKHACVIVPPSSMRATNLSRSSIWLHSFQGIWALPKCRDV